jgi:hypothetical protein
VCVCVCDVVYGVACRTRDSRIDCVCVSVGCPTIKVARIVESVKILPGTHRSNELQEFGHRSRNVQPSFR